MESQGKIEIAPLHIDVLQELINIGVGRAAGMLNQLLKSHVLLNVPEVKILEREQLPSYLEVGSDEIYSAVKLPFSGSFNGVSALMFSPESASDLVGLVIGDNDFAKDMNTMRIGTLQEVGNIVLNGVMGSIVNILKEQLDYSPPDYTEDRFMNIFNDLGEEINMVLVAKTHFLVEGRKIEGDIMLIFTLKSFDALLTAVERLAPDISQTEASS